MISPRPVPKMKLCGNSLPWVKEILHLGNTITNDLNCIEQDMRRKNARYVSKNIEINQEFYFAAPETKMTVNDVYNKSWYGSVTWDLFCPMAVKIESTWNRSIKIMLDLPYSTHRGLIEPLSGRKHLKRVLIRRFLQFIASITVSSKPVLKTILAATKFDTRATTGKNLREIMILANKHCIDDISLEDSDSFNYFPRPPEAEWKTELLTFMLEERELGNLDDGDKQFMEFLCSD